MGAERGQALGANEKSTTVRRNVGKEGGKEGRD